MRKCITLSRISLPVGSAFCVGCVIVNPANGKILTSGFSRESLPSLKISAASNYHAEQMGLAKLNQLDATVQADHLVLYTTMQPCTRRLSGNLSCVDNIICQNQQHPRGRITRVVFGVTEPGTFVQNEDGVQRLADQGIQVSWLYSGGKKYADMRRQCLLANDHLK